MNGVHPLPILAGGPQAKTQFLDHVPAEEAEPKRNGRVNGVAGFETVAVLTEELAAIWKRMPRERNRTI